MKNIIPYLLLIGSLFLAGCDDCQQRRQSKLDSPTYIGQVDGRDLYCAKFILDGGTKYIFFLRGLLSSPAISINWRAGKISNNICLIQ